MSDIRQILELEKHNDKHIRLYRIDRYWLAFERSAFNLFSACYVDTIVKVKDMKEEQNSMLIAVVKNGMAGLYNPQFTVLERSDNEVLISCRTTCGGFQHWKDSLVSLFTKNFYSVSDETSCNVSNMNLEMLLCQLGEI
ncbi:hypothetical protein JGH11_02435 [Dysgonomonas sp. Marseille-P4677]|uniref:hypothetical protein n=1 Tax=Dysgonomonas sp. Marseille-P4677 TaxID=2364790 RepID=UPI0019122F0C|nr:hypothetical protein [Dysgonomonas sp. Marseille-P4677]MBK5719724.1 hypothetical protein [Dysgonomonas sp. Marseille-P4677]